MRVPVSWLREYVELPEVHDGSGAVVEAAVAALDHALVRSGLEVEEIHRVGGELQGPLVIGEVVEITELTEFKKPIRHCQVNVGEAQPRSIVCGARNFAVGDRIVASLPGAVLPGGFQIASRQTYGQLSDGMICSVDELGFGERSGGILVLSPAEFPDLRPGDDAIAALGLRDVVFELAVTPDRGYCLSIRGVARELSHALGAPFTDPAAAVRVAPATPEPPHEIRVEDPVGCDRFAARLVRGIDPAVNTPWWMQRRLALAGQRSISFAVDITNYLMFELGQPIHAYDAATVSGPIVVRRGRLGEKLQTLDGAQRVIDAEDLVIVDDSGPIGLAAVMGGASTEVGERTTDVLIEAAHWDPVSVARTARRHKLPSEASKRFERGVDPELGPVAARRATQLLAEIAGGTLDERVLDFNVVSTPSTIELDVEQPGRVAGIEYSAAEVRGRLTEIGCEVIDGDAEGTLLVTPPSWRPDLTIPAELVEEVIRLQGYDSIPSVLPPAPASPGLTVEQRRLRSVSRALAEAGLVEIMTYPFVDPSIYDTFGVTADDPRRRACRLANPLDAAESSLRTSLLPGALAALGRNIARGQKDVALFETGLVYLPEAEQAAAPLFPTDRRPSDAEVAELYAAVPHQPRHFCAVLAGEGLRSGWWGNGEPVSWSDAVETAQVVAETAGVDLKPRRGDYAPWHPGRCAELVVVSRGTDGEPVEQVVGYAGELHPRVLAALQLPPRTVAMELNFSELPVAAAPPTPTLSAFPPVLVDVALVVSGDVPSAQVAAALRAGAGELLESLRLFDVFTGEQLGEGRKSLAYAMSFRAPDRTLTQAEATAARDAAVAEAGTRVGAVLRG